MSDEKFDVVFRGDIVMGNTLPDVKQRLGQLFKIDAAKVDALFVGRAVPLKRNLDRPTAEKYKAVLIKAGAQVSISPVGGVAKPVTKSRPQPASPSPAKPAEQKLSLKERLEQEAAAGATSAPPPPSPQRQTTPVANAGSFTLAEVGSRLVEAKPQSVVNVDVSDMSIRPMEGDLLDASEKPTPVERDIDVSGLDIAATGADLLNESERKKPEVVGIPDPDFDIADVGADMLDTSDRIPLPEVDLDLSEYDLAPIGSDMNQTKKPSPPPPPDTSSLSLAD